MLTDPRAIEIISRARQSNVAVAQRDSRDFDRIFADFFSGETAQQCFAGRTVCDIGPGQYDFARCVTEAGGTCVNIDYDPAVLELGRYLGYEVIEADLKDFDASAIDCVGRFDGLFCKFSFNALWFVDGGERHARLIRALDSMLKPGGWGWIAPWNGRSLPELKHDDEAVHALLDVQRQTFASLGWQVHDLTDAQAQYYGMGGAVEDHPLYLKNLDLSVEPQERVHQ